MKRAGPHDVAGARRDGGASPRVACDSLVALRGATADGAVLLAKNSDRPAGECQRLVQVPRRRHPPGARVRCQYVEIPQVGETAALIGSQPFWLWGFEHGLNEHGVAIGNHTVFTRDPLTGFGLIGMDLVRLGLERGRTAREATDVIGSLIERHGQGGSGYFDKDWPYHNSFLVADRSEAYLLETSDRHWAMRRIRATGSATNHLTIGEDWDELGPQTVQHAVAAGWCEGDRTTRFDFAAAYRDTDFAPDVISRGRYRRTCDMLATLADGRCTPESMMAALRDHYGKAHHRPGLTPDDERYFSVCMHADPVGTTTASMVARLPNEDRLIQYWGSLGSPCLGVFLPYYLGGRLPEILSRGGEHHDPGSPWWRFKEISALVERDFELHAPAVRARWDDLERSILQKAPAVEQEALDLRRRGRHGESAEVLSRFMAGNVETMLAHLDSLARELRSA